MRTWILVIIGAVLPLVLGGTLGMIESADSKGTWSDPMDPTAFGFLSAGLAVSHLLILLGYLAIAKRTDGVVSTFARIAALGTLLVAACELWSGGEAKTNIDADRLTTLEASYFVASVVIVVGTIGAGWALRSTSLSVPLLINGAALTVAAIVQTLISDGWGVAALTIWSLLYIPIALRLRDSDRAVVRQST